MTAILLLDDDSRFRKLVATLLEKRGYSFHEAGTGAQAKEILSSHHVDLVIVDYRLPDTDGISWIAWLRELHSALPVMFLSGFSCDKTMLNKLRNVFNVPIVLQKPIDPNSFVAVVNRHFNDGAGALKRWRAKGNSEPNILAIDKLDCFIPVAVGGQSDEESDGDDFGADLEAVRVMKAEYLAELPARLLQLARAINSAAHNDAGVIDEAINDAHRLRGTSGCYGFHEIGESMGTVEDLLLSIVDSNGALTDARWASVADMVCRAMTLTLKAAAA